MATTKEGGSGGGGSSEENKETSAGLKPKLDEMGEADLSKKNQGASAEIGSEENPIELSSGEEDEEESNEEPAPSGQLYTCTLCGDTFSHSLYFRLHQEHVHLDY